MISKPSGCLGCPFYADGQGYVPDEIVPGASVLVVLQNPGEEEERKGKPAIGATGDLLNETFLPQAGLTRGVDVSVANALRCRWVDSSGVRSNKLPSGKVLDEAISSCRQYDRFSGHEVIVAAGGTAWKAMGQPGLITEWRGFLGPEKVEEAKVLGSLHPADLFRDPKMKLPSMKDWRKVQDVLRGDYPKPVPSVVQIPYQGTVDTLEAWARVFRSPVVAVDTEYQRDTQRLDLLGFGGTQEDFGIQVWWQQLSEKDQDAVRDILLSLFARVPVVFQNSFADIPILFRNVQIPYTAYSSIEDTMLAHAVLWSEWPHSLEFLASIYGQYPKMKHLSKTDPSLYNWGDVLETISIHGALEHEFQRDPQSRRIYNDQSLALVPILLKSMERGLKVDKVRVDTATRSLESIVSEAQLLARAHVGWPINLASEKHLKEYLYTTAGLPMQRDKDTKKSSTGADAIAALRRLVGPDYDPDSELTLGLACERIREGADPILEARVIYAGAQQILSHYLTPLDLGHGRIAERIFPQFKIHAQASGRWSTTDPPLAQLPSDLRDIIIPDPGGIWIGWDWDGIEMRLLSALAKDEVYLEAFEKGWDVHSMNAQDLFSYATKEGRIDQSMSRLRDVFLRTQVSGIDREMVFKLVQEFEAGVDSSLAGQGLVSAAEQEWRSRIRASRGGESWPGRGCTSLEWSKAGQFTGQLGKDYSERAWTLAHAAWIACGGPPPDWLGKDDIRRVFAKRFVYRLNYGGDPKHAGDIPGAAVLGLRASDLVRASQRYLQAHPKLAQWRTQVAADARSSRVSRTFMGRRRRLLSSGDAAVREAFNHPMQGGVADILNLVTVRIARQLPYATLCYTMHDSAWWAVPAEKAEEADPVIRSIVEDIWDVQGVPVRFPATFKRRM